MSASNEKEIKEKLQQQQHMLICAILEAGALVFNLNTAALPLVVVDDMMGEGMEDMSSSKQPLLFSAVNSLLTMPQLAGRLAGAWCLHCVGLALPSQLSFLVGHCVAQLRNPEKHAQVRSRQGILKEIVEPLYSRHLWDKLKCPD